MIVLGIDGMDYDLTQKMMAEGRMPHFSRLAETGSFSALGTSIPPQSPVAWSNFITGMDSGGHGIFDFVHRNPDTLMPYFSSSRTEGADRSLKLGKWQIPLSGGKVELLRRGQPFWEVLEENGIPTTIIRMPANFPPSGTATRELSGMGTPDLPGSPGTFSFYFSELFAFDGEEINGGEVYEVYPYDNTVEENLYGPENPFLVDSEKAEAPFTVFMDPESSVAKLVVGEEELIIQVGEWSDWVPVHFDLAPTQSVTGMVRFYLKQLRPELELYATPVNIDPMEPAMPISTPDSYAKSLAQASGRFYTQGMPEDTAALSSGVFTVGEFLDQALLAGDELIDQYRYVLDEFDSGLLFYYFGNLDQVCHMMWRTLDPSHPAYDPEVDPQFADIIPKIYERFDSLVGYTLERLAPGTRLVVMSDHGFTSWRRSFNLNTWLRENGYIVLKGRRRSDDPGSHSNVDWSQTKAYGLGLNGLYVNLKGRERDGIVAPDEREALMEEIAAKLLAYIDPDTSEPAVTKMYWRERDYRDRGELEIGPDLIVGYAKGTRSSGDSALGEFSVEIVSENTEEWSGDHLMDHEAVPGILLTSEPLGRPASTLTELATSILADFGIEGFPARSGDAGGVAAGSR